MNDGPSGHVDFDAFAGCYESALEAGLALAGEGRAYFARRRIAWLAACLQELGERPRSVLDFGCGTGIAVPLFRDLIGAERVVGVDTSRASLAVARQSHGRDAAHFVPFAEFQPAGVLDLGFANGVFHHIRPEERPATVDLVYRALRPGGLFAFWENNPWSPGARYVMRRIPFDRDAVMVAPAKARHLLRAGRFEVVRTDFLFIFPRALRWLRPLEAPLARLPLGAQYQVLARRPRQA